MRNTPEIERSHRTNHAIWSLAHHLGRVRWLSRLTVVGAVLAVGVVPATAANAGPAHATLQCSTAYLTSALHVPDVTVDSATPETTGRYTPPGATAPITELPAFCAVELTQTGSTGNPMQTAVWLPTRWNGRFQGIGGGGYSCGIYYSATPGFVSPSLQSALEGGYASASTDCGVPVAAAYTGTWALTPSGQLDQSLIKDWASIGIHDMTVTGQALTRAYYSSAPTYSYFVGCSTGGREGLNEAQRYSTDYNGIVSGSPAINWPSWVPAAIWPALVMKESNDVIPTCKEGAFQAAVVKACDSKDGVTDGIISDPADCHWNANQLIGTDTPCGVITATDATVMNKIWQGPVTDSGRLLWPGIERGASLSYLGATSTTNRVTTVQPFAIPVGWLGTWLLQNTNWNWQTLTYAEFETLFAQSNLEFSSVVATNSPNLKAFASHGGKILIWHGLADPLIPDEGTVGYYQSVQRPMGGAASMASFARLFLAPGAGHCAPAAGPTPDDPLAAVVSWVEHGKAPLSIPATLINPTTRATVLSRPLCSYPLVARYTGHGSTNDARNFTCARTTRVS